MTVLLVLMAPLLAVSQRAGTAAACSQQLRLVGQGLRQYALDHEGLAPPGRWLASDALRARYPDAAGAPEVLGAQTHPAWAEAWPSDIGMVGAYVETTESRHVNGARYTEASLWRCPADREEGSRMGGVATYPASYGINLDRFNTIDAPGALDKTWRMADAASPSTLLCFVDAETTGFMAASADKESKWPIARRHGAGPGSMEPAAMAVFLDGHVDMAELETQAQSADAT